MMGSLKKLRCLTYLLVAGMLLATRPVYAADDSLIVAYPFDVPNWDPTAVTFVGAQSIYKAIYDSPLQYSPDLKLEPRLVKEWHFQDPEKKRLEITLRDGVLFQDGTPLTTADVKFSIIDRPAKDPTLLIRRIMPAMDGVEIISPTKAVLVFKNSSPAAAIYLAFLAGYFVPKAYIEKVGEDGFKQHPIGAGPYKLVQYDRGARIVLEAFDQYWGGAPKIKHVTFQIVTDPSARVAAVEAGRADLAIQVPIRELARLGKIPGLVATSTPFAEIVMLVTPSYVPVFQDENVRLAMQLAIDKTAISKAFYAGLAIPLSVLATPGTESFVPGYNFPYDKARAMALLKKSGFSPEHPVTFPFITTNGAFPNDFDVARAIAAMWKAVGIQADIQEVSLAKYVDMNHSGTLTGTALYSWANPTGDPEDYIGKILDSSLPFAAWKDPAIGDRVHKLIVETDDAKRNAGYQALEKDSSEHGWAPPLFQSVFTMVYKKSLHVVPYQGGYIMPADYYWGQK
jgi:peptide/nickel transport system substrate-binding protein